MQPESLATKVAKESRSGETRALVVVEQQLSGYHKHGWVTYVLGRIAPTLRILRSQIHCKLYKSPWGETHTQRMPPWVL